MKYLSSRIILSLLGGIAMLAGGVSHAGADFSADMVTTNPQGQSQTVHMVVSKGRVRTDFENQGRKMAQITDPAGGKVWLMMIDTKQFMSRASAGKGAASGMPIPGAGTGNGERNPCAGLQGVTCHRAGEEIMHGRTAVKWIMSMERGGQTLTSTQWIDSERGLPLRQEFGQGTYAEMVPKGMDEIDGRSVERWELAQARRGAEPAYSTQWYDPELQTTIREERSDGNRRELRNIQVGDQDENLFQIPKGYRRYQPAASR